jgi:flavin-dependent dehydrogenase
MGLSQNRCDVLVIGGGPAGLAAAIALRQSSVDVLLADALVPPIDKACGEGIMPDSRRELAQLGVDLNCAHGAAFHGILFGDERSTVTANFSSGEGIGLRRVVLHSLLVDRARDIGVRLRWGTPVVLNPGQPASIAGERVTYRYLIGADGQSSRVRTWVGLSRGTLHTRRFGFRMHYRIAPWSDYVEVHWGPLGQAYVTPVGADEICVAVVTRFPGMVRTAQVIDSIPALREKLRDAEITSRERGSITTTRTLHHVVRENVALLGDASGSADAITGEGLAMAFRQALLLAASIEGGSLDAYAGGHGKTLRIPQSMARSLLLMDRWPALRGKVLRVLAREPLLSEKLLRVHMGEDSLHRFLLQHAPQLGCRMLLPSPA